MGQQQIERCDMDFVSVASVALATLLKAVGKKKKRNEK